MPRFLHTSYRIGEIERSVAFYGKLGFREIERKPVDEEEINVFLGLAGEDPRLKLIYRRGVHSYDLGNGYSHFALAVEDLGAMLARLASHGIHPEQAPYPAVDGEGKSLACFVRDPDGYRVQLIGPDGDDPGLSTDEETEKGVEIDPSRNLVLPSEGTGGEDVLRALWNDERFARIVNTGADPLLMRLPYAPDNRDWLRGGKRRKLSWNKKRKRWQLPLSRHDELIEKAVARYGEVIVVKHAKSQVLKCAPACWKAKSDAASCKCSCEGALHGIGGNPGGFREINEALAVKLGNNDGQVVVTFVTKRGARASHLRATWHTSSS